MFLTLAFDPKAGHLFSEFSGYGTAEYVWESILNKSGLGPEGFTKSSADMLPACRKLLQANCNGGCVFSNILNLAPQPLRKTLCEDVTETFNVTKGDVLVALDSLSPARSMSKPRKLVADDLFTSQKRLKCKLGPVGRDYAIVGLVDGTDSLGALTQMNRWLASASTQECCDKFLFSRRSAPL